MLDTDFWIIAGPVHGFSFFQALIEREVRNKMKENKIETIKYKLKNNKLLEFLGLNTLTILGFNYMTNFACDTILGFIGIKYWYINLPVQMVLLVLIILTLNKVTVLNFFYNGRTMGYKRFNPA